MQAVTVHLVDEDLLISMKKLPGFKLLGTCSIRYKGDNQLEEVYYSGEFFKQPRAKADLRTVESQITKIAKNYATKRGIDGTVMRLNLSKHIRKDLNSHDSQRQVDHQPVHQADASSDRYHGYPRFRPVVGTLA